jgi:hypothetical protein
MKRLKIACLLSLAGQNEIADDLKAPCPLSGTAPVDQPARDGKRVLGTDEIANTRKPALAQRRNVFVHTDQSR